MLHRRFAFATLVILALAACGGSNPGPFYPPASSSTPSSTESTVSFLVVVPSASVTARRRNVVLPSSATSVTFTLDSVNGSSYTGTPTKEALSASNSACASVNGQLSCAFNISAPVGTLIWTVAASNGTSVIAEGNVSVTTTAGSTVTAPLTLSGTAAKITISVGATVVGISATVPVTVQVEDSNGNTILGTYTSPITLTDSDTSGQTSIATSGSDHPPAGELLSSADSATLSYAGGTVSATIGATASGVSASNVTAAIFTPTTNILAESGTATFGVTVEGSSSGYDTQAPSPSPSPVTTSYPIAVATGQTFDGASNLVGVTGLPESSATNLFPISSSATTYYSWSSTSNGAVLGFVGYSDPANTEYPNITLLTDESSLTQKCAAPYPQLFISSMPATWSVYGNAGACTTTYADTAGDTDVYAYSGNGAYTDNYTLSSGGWAPCSCVAGSSSISVSASGALTYSIDSNFGTGSVTVPAPSPGASTISVAFVNGPDAILPTPVPSSAPNPWLAIGLANGVAPNPLFSDTVTTVGAISSLPAACAVPAGLVPSTNPPLTEADETIVAGDPMDDWIPLYTAIAIKHYYLTGVGEVCNEQIATYDIFDAVNSDSIDYGLSTGPPVWSFSTNPTGALAWYSGVDPNWDSYSQITYTYITQTTLTATSERVRDFKKTMQVAAQSFTTASYALARSEMRRFPALHRHRTIATSAHW